MKRITIELQAEGQIMLINKGGCDFYEVLGILHSAIDELKYAEYNHKQKSEPTILDKVEKPEVKPDTPPIDLTPKPKKEKKIKKLTPEVQPVEVHQAVPVTKERSASEKKMDAKLMGGKGDQAMVDKAYQKALDLFKSALILDPTNEAMKKKIANCESWMKKIAELNENEVPEAKTTPVIEESPFKDKPDNAGSEKVNIVTSENDTDLDIDLLG